MTIKMFDAGKGDSILIQSSTTNVLIDGGTKASFDNWFPIIKDLEKIDAIFITHIDDDHTNGIIKFLEHNKTLETPIQIEYIFFNGFEQLFELVDEEETEPTYKFNGLISRYNNIESGEVGFSEGTSLSYILQDNLYKEKVNKNIIHNNLEKSYCIGDIKIEILSPTIDSLEELKYMWKEVLDVQGISKIILTNNHTIAFENYVNHLNKQIVESKNISSETIQTIDEHADESCLMDNSLANKTSLALLVESDGKKVLMLGDCHIEPIVQYMNKNDIDEISLDAIKVSHHGSKRNISKEFLEKVICNKYLISTNGHHNHPDIETLAKIAKYSKKTGTEIFINNNTEKIEEKIDDELIEKFEQYEKSTKIVLNKKEIEL